MIQRVMLVILTIIYRGEYKVTRVYSLEYIEFNNTIFPGLNVKSLEVAIPP